MGACASVAAAETDRSRELDAQQDAAATADRQTIRLLLLGAGESGKSTIFKQMRLLYGTGFSDAERAAYRSVICSNCIVSMRTLVEYVLTQRMSDIASPSDVTLFSANQTQPDYNLPASDVAQIQAAAEDIYITDSLAGAIERLWATPAIKRAYENRSQFQLADSAAHFFDEIRNIAMPNYVPSMEDVLLARERTTGIREEHITVDGVTFVIIDVGGQRTERKKWIHCFEGVTAVIFVAALSEYDQVLVEDASVNRLMEALELFGEIANNKWFQSSSLILFLNKRDLFEEKIKRYDLASTGQNGQPKRFEDYTGGCDAEAALKYIIEKFAALPHRSRSTYIHVTTATDSSNVRVVFSACKEAILRENLESTGLLVDSGQP